jgi:hypothetical protein
MAIEPFSLLCKGKPVPSDFFECLSEMGVSCSPSPLARRDCKAPILRCPLGHFSPCDVPAGMGYLETGSMTSCYLPDVGQSVG